MAFSKAEPEYRGLGLSPVGTELAARRQLASCQDRSVRV